MVLKDKLPTKIFMSRISIVLAHVWLKNLAWAERVGGRDRQDGVMRRDKHVLPEGILQRGKAESADETSIPADPGLRSSTMGRSVS